MTTHSSILAWRIPWTEEPGRLQFMGSQKVGHDRETNIWASLVAQTERNPPAMWETWIPSLGREDPLEKGMATDSSILAWRILWTEDSMRLQRVKHVSLSD